MAHWRKTKTESHGTGDRPRSVKANIKAAAKKIRRRNDKKLCKGSAQ